MTQNVSLTKEEALQESAFIAGMKYGFNLGVVEDHEAMHRAIANREGYLKPLSAARRHGEQDRGSNGSENK